MTDDSFDKFMHKQRRFEKWHKYFVYQNPIWKKNFGHLTEYIEAGILDPELKKQLMQSNCCDNSHYHS